METRPSVCSVSLLFKCFHGFGWNYVPVSVRIYCEGELLYGWPSENYVCKRQLTKDSAHVKVLHT